MKKISQDKKNSIITYLNDDLSIRDIANITGISKSTIQRISSEINKPISNKKLGRPIKLNRRQKLFCISKITKGNKDNAIQVVKDLKTELGVEVSPNTVHRTLREAGLGSMEKPKKPMLSKKNIKERLQFAKTYRNWTIHDWCKLLQNLFL